VVDAAQGVEAQSVANCYTAIEQGLEVLPVLNKIDLPQADPERVRQEIEEIIGLDASDACLVSAKSGLGIEDCWRLVAQIPPPEGDRDAPLQALIIDSWFDLPRRRVAGARQAGRAAAPRPIVTKSTGKQHQVDGVGIFTPKREERRALRPARSAS
jgi:GTP-binding protein LepA